MRSIYKSTDLIGLNDNDDDYDDDGTSLVNALSRMLETVVKAKTINSFKNRL